MMDHLKQIEKSKDIEFKKKESFKALTKCYTANAAYEEIKTVMRKSRFHDLQTYLYLFFKGVEDFGETLPYRSLHKPIWRGINAKKDQIGDRLCIDNYEVGIVGSWA